MTPYLISYPKRQIFLYLNKVYIFLMLSFPNFNKRPNFWFRFYNSKPRDCIPNPETLLQSKEIYSKPRDFTPNPGNLLQTLKL